MSPQTIVVVEPILKSSCTLGEGPLYDPATATLHFVDIVERKVYHFNTVDSSVVTNQYEVPITSIALRQGAPGQLAATTARGFALLNADGSLQYIAEPLEEKFAPFTRFNDGLCDSKGRYFAGTVYSPEHGIAGKLYKYDPANQTCTIVDEGPFTDSNGLGWSVDEKTFYFTDSFVNLIYMYDYDIEGGTLSNRRTVIDAKQLGYTGFCDGLCIDTEGAIWSARWGDSRICRFIPNSGVADLEIIFPTVLNVTSCCFGGPNNDQLFVTSSHCGAIGGDPCLQTEYPDSGHLFKVDLAGKYKGRERYPFAG
ncbi:hypothetical protein BDP27DRAFT_1383343 [Rhodocollybia butyracea]|uniref:SMP-30/Gluconolactonase/LRE-like region domain-containing protein n=1 Tax=Rhodocollybia butyracea TaxID=206335 RepID=A0A9P5PV92_9AGAR|nr:hypothetical protein BDP27DRAFT_1383343 [Rhodocollybia butyracea]